MRFFAPAAALSVGVLALYAIAPAWAQEGRLIDEIEVRGTKNTNAEVVRLASGLKAGDVYTKEAVQKAVEAIRERGFYEVATARPDITADNKLVIIFDVVERPVISSIVITGNRSVPRSEIDPFLLTKPGNVLNLNDLRKDVEKIESIYADKGYIAYIADEARVDPATNELLIPVTETTIQAVEVTGNVKTKSYVVTREMQLKPGSVFNRNVLQKDLTRVFGLGLFADVTARPEPGTDLGLTKLVVPVQEQRTGQVGVIFGYSVRQRLTGTLSLSENNFRGRGQNVNVSWTVGGITAQNSFELGFAEPWIDKNGTSLAVNVYDRLLFRFNRQLTDTATSGQDDDPYTERRRGGAITLSRPFGSFTSTTRGFVTARAESVNANNLQVNYNNLTNDQIGNLRGSLVQRGDLQSLTLRTATDGRDNPLDPASGIYFSPLVEFGSAKFNYERPRVNPAYISDVATPNTPRVITDQRSQNGAFTKLNLDARSYFSLNGPRRESFQEAKRVLATRVLLGTSTGNIGFAEQYFLGGVDNLRGYNDDRFWGNNLFLASVELRIPFDKSGTIGGAIFTDIGDAWGATEANRENIAGFEQHFSFRPNVGFGIGIRAKTPIGPVRLDYGIGETNRIHFGIGQVF